MDHASWESTITFRRFRAQHTELSKLHWTHQLGSDAITSCIQGHEASSCLVPSIIGASFRETMLPINPAEMRAWLDEYLGRARLHLLLVCAANLESYLREITLVYLASIGHSTSEGKLTPVGKALGDPILSRASLPEPLRYAESLFGVDLGRHRSTWDRSYKLRCAVAHSGGVVTARVMREISDLHAELHDILGLSWPDLRESLNAADEIAAKLDRKIATPRVRREEAIRELRALKEVGRLPPRETLWKFLFDEFGFRGLGRENQNLIARMFYGR